MYNVGVRDAVSLDMGPSVHFCFWQNFSNEDIQCCHIKTLLDLQGTSQCYQLLNNPYVQCARTDHGSAPWSNATQEFAPVYEAAQGGRGRIPRDAETRGQRQLFELQKL